MIKMKNPEMENQTEQPQEPQGITTNTINNQDQTIINTQSIDRRKAGSVNKQSMAKLWRLRGKLSL